MAYIDKQILQMDRIGLDDFTRRHLNRWLYQHVYQPEHDAVKSMILDLLEQDPGLLDGHSWPELRDMAEALAMDDKTKEQLAK